MASNHESAARTTVTHNADGSTTTTVTTTTPAPRARLRTRQWSSLLGNLDQPSYLDSTAVMRMISWKKYLKSNVSTAETPRITKLLNYSCPRTKPEELEKSFLKELINWASKRCQLGWRRILKKLGRSTTKIKRGIWGTKKLLLSWELLSDPKTNSNLPQEVFLMFIQEVTSTNLITKLSIPQSLTFEEMDSFFLTII